MESKEIRSDESEKFSQPLKHNVSGSVCGRETDVPCKGKVCSGSARGRAEKGVKPSNPSMTSQQI